jgi:integrase
MANISFWLKDPNAKTESLIFLYFSYEGKRFKYSTGFKVNPINWAGNKVKKNAAINARLSILGSDVLSIYATLKSKKQIITNELLRKELEQLQVSTNPTAPKANNGFLIECIDLCITDRKDRVQPNTLKKFTSLKFNVNYFQDHFAIRHIKLTEVNHDFYKRFTKLLYANKKLQDTTVGKLIIALRIVLKWCSENGFEVPPDFKKFKIPARETQIITLTQKEFLKIYSLELGEHERLKKARDLFCFCALTGLRFSDVIQIQKSNVTNGELNFSTQKTKANLKIPLSPMAIDILERYEYSLPKISNQKLNDYLKEIGQLAELNDPVVMIEYRGTKQERHEYKKWECLTSHTARRTFVTIGLQNGMRPETVMSITGHKDMRTMRPYIQITGEAKKNELFKAWDFNK